MALLSTIIDNYLQFTFVNSFSFSYLYYIIIIVWRCSMSEKKKKTSSKNKNNNSGNEVNQPIEEVKEIVPDKKKSF